MNDDFLIPETYSGQRLDQVLVAKYPEFSRSRIQTWIKTGAITLNLQQVKPKTRVYGGEQVRFQLTQPAETTVFQPQAIALDIVFEDESILVVNKSANMVVHPGAGNYQGTLLNALLHHCPQLQAVPRAGIVHRLDKDTTGLLVVAKTVQAHNFLVKQLQQRAFEREYQALVYGSLSGGGTIDTLFGRNPRHRTKMAVLPEQHQRGKRAITHYRIIQRYYLHSRLAIRLETGRTHQIRVHMAYQQLPLVGDPTYGRRLQLPPRASEALKQALSNFKRQALHAWKLGLQHPQHNTWMRWEQTVPDDMQQLFDLLEQHAQEN